MRRRECEGIPRHSSYLVSCTASGFDCSPSLPSVVRRKGGHGFEGPLVLSGPSPVARGGPAGLHWNVLTWRPCYHRAGS